jgi:hypothetical protein
MSSISAALMLDELNSRTSSEVNFGTTIASKIKTEERPTIAKSEQHDVATSSVYELDKDQSKDLP